ncbi:MAG: LysE family transporter [Bacteroidales bacterium]|nr:LysE family transporter [Candidatus Cacconaster merdequi]
MIIASFVRAILIGLGASIPLGPLGIMCIQKTLSKGRWSGFSVGLGASLGDTIYAAIALFSIAFVSEFLDNNRLWVMVIGGAIIFFIGLMIAMKNPIKDLRQTKTINATKHLQDVGTGFLMTMTNPGAIVLMLALFAYFHLDLGSVGYKPYAVSVVLSGIFIGTATWWFILSGTISLFRKRFRLRQLITVNRVSGIAIAVFGLISVTEGLFQMLFIN